MSRGGKRPGAGRKPGAATKMNEEARKAALASGISPLDFLLSTMRDEGREFDTRLDAAKAAAPYVHARLAAVEHSGNEDRPIRQEVTIIELVAPAMTHEGED